MKPKVLIWKMNRDNKSAEPVALDHEIESLDQASSLLPQGVYTSFRTYGRYSGLHLEEHFGRLIEGAEMLGKEVSVDITQIRFQLRSILRELEGDDFRIRMSIDLENQVGDIYILVENLIVPSAIDYQNGVNALTQPFERENARVKSTRFILNSSAYRALVSNEVNEVLLFNSNREILEGLSSNFFGVRDAIIYTASEGILPGISRSILLEEIQKESIRLVLRPVYLNEIGKIDESFITSTSRAVLPIHKINNIIIGAGEPGPITRRLSASYQARIERELKLI